MRLLHSSCCVVHYNKCALLQNVYEKTCREADDYRKGIASQNIMQEKKQNADNLFSENVMKGNLNLDAKSEALIESSRQRSLVMNLKIKIQ